MNNKTPAFPSQSLGQSGLPEDQLQEGMTLRDYFAAKAMLGIISNPTNYISYGRTETAKLAFKTADAMMEARKEQSE
jgi:hypothetical protein